MPKASQSKIEYNMKYNAETFRQIKFNLSKKYDLDIIAALDAVDNKQGYIKDLIRADIARNAGTTQNLKEDKPMTYHIKPEYIDLWGDDATEDTVITAEDLEMIARGREKTPEELLDQLIPIE